MTDPWLVFKQVVDVMGHREQAFKEQLAALPAPTSSQASTSTVSDQATLKEVQETLRSHGETLEAIQAAIRKNEEVMAEHPQNLEQLRVYVEDALKSASDAPCKCTQAASPNELSKIIKRIESMESALVDHSGLEKKFNTMQRAMSSLTKAEENARNNLKNSMKKLDAGLKKVRVRMGKIEDVQKKYKDHLEGHSETVDSKLRSIRFDLESQKEALEELEDRKVYRDEAHDRCEPSTSMAVVTSTAMQTKSATESLTDMEEEEDYIFLKDGLRIMIGNMAASDSNTLETNDEETSKQESARESTSVPATEGGLTKQPSPRALKGQMSTPAGFGTDCLPVKSSKVIHPEKHSLDRPSGSPVVMLKRKSAEAHIAAPPPPRRGSSSQEAIILSPEPSDVIIDML